MNTSIKIFFIISIITFFASACKPDKENNKTNNSDKNNKVAEANPLKLNISAPEKDNYYIGDIIKISANCKDFQNTDSILLFINGLQTQVFSKQNCEYSLNTKNAKTGTLKVEIKANLDNKNFKQSKSVILLSDIEPENYTYKVKNRYKHDIAAYTQGLFYHNGELYEATGLKGESTVRKVNPQTGEVLQSFAIPKDVFGEGICLFNNKIIQITWQAGRGYVYDLETFKHLDQFSYMGEGWGITTDGKSLFMSNGSEEIKILEPNNYSQTDKLEVYDNKGKVIYLNELEYIDGEIYANIYQYEKIARIDPKTGKVLAYIDLSRILPFSDYTQNTDVLNGIAYDSDKKRLFVTGKKWPKLFEIELIKK